MFIISCSFLIIMKTDEIGTPTPTRAPDNQLEKCKLDLLVSVNKHRFGRFLGLGSGVPIPSVSAGRPRACSAAGAPPASGPHFNNTTNNNSTDNNNKKNNNCYQY